MSMNLKGILIDLHLHLDGSLSMETIKHLAKTQNIAIPSDVELKKMLSVPKDCADLNEYLDKFRFPLSLLQTKEAITYATYALCEELANQGLMYAEIRFAPQLHTNNGLSQTEVVRAVIKGAMKSKLHTNIILCCMRGNNNRKENVETVIVAKKFLGKGVCALDLAGAEGLYKTKTFDYMFRCATCSDIPMTVHCGEADGPDSIKSAVKWNPRRLGHGVRVLEDKYLMEYLAKRNIYFELCPTSNLNTKVYDSYCEYPVKKMLRNGLKVTINTDNRTVSDTSIIDEFNHIIAGNNLDANDVAVLLKNSVNASFARKSHKKAMHKKINRMMKEATI